MAGKYEGASRAEILDRVGERAYELLDKYHGCAQCGLLAIQEVFDLQDERLFKAASGLSGGVGGMHSLCGSLTGAGLALGLKYGRELSDLEKSPDEAVEKERASLEPVGKLYKWFEREFGSVICSDIRKSFIGVDLDTTIPWQKEMADELGVHKHCCELAKKTARRVAALLMDANCSLAEKV